MNIRLKCTVAALFMTLLLVVGWYFVSRQLTLAIPAADEVISVTASLFDQSGTSNKSEFVIPKSHHAEILDLFRDAQPDANPSKWQVLGSVNIESDSETKSISLYQTGQLTGAFSSSQKYYRGSTDNAIMRAIEAAKAAAK